MKIKRTSKHVLHWGLFQLHDCWQKHPPVFSSPLPSFSKTTPLTPCFAFSTSVHVSEIFAFADGGNRACSCRPPPIGAWRASAHRCRHRKGLPCPQAAPARRRGGTAPSQGTSPAVSNGHFRGFNYQPAHRATYAHKNLLECIRIMSAFIKIKVCAL